MTTVSMRCAALVAVLFLLPTAPFAEVIAITGATVHTAGPAGTIESGTVLIDNGRIASVGPDIDIPAGARRIDAGGKPVTPGLVSPFGQIGLVEVGGVPGTVDFVQRGDRYTASFDVSEAYNPRSTLVATNRIDGITHAVIAPSSAEIDMLGNESRVLAGLASLVDLGSTSDFLVAHGVGVVASLGETGGGFAAGSRAAALLQLRSALSDSRDFLEHRGAYESGDRRRYSVSHEDLAVLGSLLQGERKLLVHVHRASDIRAVIRLAADFGLDVVILGAAEAWLVADALAAAEIPVVLDSLGNLPADFDRLNARLDSPALLSSAGVSFAIGGDSANQNHNARNVTQAAGIAVANGLDWSEALRAITAVPAAIYGVADRIGSIEPGKAANLVIWSGDPLELRTYPEQVYIGGEPVPMESRQTLLRDRYLDRGDRRPPAFRPAAAPSGASRPD